MTKIKKITVSNLKAVSSLTADFNGCTAIVTGRNNSGKTSFLRALSDRLKSIKAPVLKQGEKEGFYEMELTNGEKLIWTFNNKAEKLTLITEKNIKTSITKEIGQTYFPKVFDVDRFLTDEPSKQKAAIEKIAGIDFSELNKLHAAAYEERTWSKRVLDEEAAKKIDFKPEWSNDLQPVEGLEAELSGIEAHNLRWRTIQEKLHTKVKQRDRNLLEIQELEQKISRLKDENFLIEEDEKKGNAWLTDEKNMQKIPEHAIKLKEKIRDIRDNNFAIKRQMAYDKALANYMDADKEVKRLEADKFDAVKNSSLPEGFAFDGDKVTYNGTPFTKQSMSSSGIYIAALKLATVGIGEVRTLHFDASYLDKISLQEIEEWASKNNLQLLIERPDFEAGEIEYQIIQDAKEGV